MNINALEFVSSKLTSTATVVGRSIIVLNPSTSGALSMSGGATINVGGVVRHRYPMDMGMDINPGSVSRRTFPAASRIRT